MPSAGFETVFLELKATIDVPDVPAPPALQAALDVLLGAPLAGVAAATTPAVRTIELPVVRYAASWAVNAIPSAAIALALGRQLSEMTAASTHALQDFLRAGLVTKVYARAKQDSEILRVLNVVGLDELVRTFSGDFFLIFEGVTRSCQYLKNIGGAAGFELTLAHWLEALTRSSSVTGVLHPGSINIFTMPSTAPAPARVNPVGVAGSGLTSRATTAPSRAFNFLTPATLSAGDETADIWGNPPARSPDEGIQSWLMAETNTDIGGLPDITRLLPRELSTDPDFQRDISNHAALSALQRFEPLATGGTYRRGAPLRLRPPEDVEGGWEEHTQRAITQMLGMTGFGQLSGQTMWQSLLSFGQQLNFAVIPLVDTALVAPFIKGLRAPKLVIPGSDFRSIHDTKELQYELRAVAALGGPSAPANSNGLSGVAGQPGILGWYQGSSRGRILFVMAPPWITIGGWPRHSPATTGVDGVRGSVFNPADAAIAAAAGAAPAVALSGIRHLQRAFADRFARSVYVNEVIGYRQIELECRLRFDIAPGTVVEIEGVPEEFLAESDTLARDMVGTVMQVDMVIDAEAPQAYTNLRIENARTKLENALDAASLDEHPLWRDTWTGCKLVERT